MEIQNKSFVKGYLLKTFPNNKCADLAAHPYGLLSAFVIRFLDRNVPIASLVSDQAGFCHPGDRFFSRFSSYQIVSDKIYGKQF